MGEVKTRKKLYLHINRVPMPLADGRSGGRFTTVDMLSMITQNTLSFAQTSILLYIYIELMFGLSTSITHFCRSYKYINIHKQKQHFATTIIYSLAS